MTFHLTLPETILFFIALAGSLYFAFRIAERIYRILRRGQGEIDMGVARKRLFSTLAKTITLQPTFRIRLVPSLFHAFIAWAFIYYLLVNLVDVLEGLITGFDLSALLGPFSGPFRLAADLLSVAALVGMVALLWRRFVLKSGNLTARSEIMLHPAARTGIRRDSAIVGGFIIIHVGARFLGQSFIIAAQGRDPWQPLASGVSLLWQNLTGSALTIAFHISFWLAIGTILAFIP